MPIQFSGTLNVGQFQVWSTWGWSREFFVNWSVRPSPGNIGLVSLRALAVEAAKDGTLSYVLTVWNVGTKPVRFDALYATTTTEQVAFDDGAGAYTIDAGQVIGLDWDLGQAPSLVSFIPIPQATGTSFECSIPSVTKNANGTGTYSFSVTNTGAQRGAFRMRAMLS